MSANGQVLPRRFWVLAGAVSVRTKIFGIVLGSTLLLSLAFAWQFQTVQVSVLEEKTREQGISIARDVAARATDLILINDLFGLHQLLIETQRNYQDIRYIFITNPDGTVLAHTFGSGFPKDLLTTNQFSTIFFQHTQTLETSEGLVWDVAVPIFEGKAGIARVGISDAGLRQTVGTMTAQISLTILAVLAVSLLAATFLTWLLTRPVLGLVSATQAVARGDFTQRVPRWADDEIGDLADAFNQMTSELARMDGLRNEKEQLRRKLLENVITAQEEERSRIARELHDSTSQSLTSLMVGLRNMERNCDKPQVHRQVLDMRRVVRQTLEEVHDLAVQLRPVALDDLGLLAALTRMAEEWEQRHSVTVDIVFHIGAERLPGSIETALYRIVQEALANVSRHALARTVSILINHRNAEIVTIIEDDGCGFDVDQANKNGRLGLVGIRERAELLGGHVTIESSPEKGTSLYIYLPATLPVETDMLVHE